jgi:hypothetical protein
MMCCNKCPFHPTLGTEKERCHSASCELPANMSNGCTKTSCPQDLGMRCFLDYFVINNLHCSELARKLVLHTLKTALIGRDRPLLMALFYAADRLTQEKMWSWLNCNIPRSLWLLNPVFEASGLPSLERFDEAPRVKNKYIHALASYQEESSLRRYVQNNLVLRRLANEM